MREALLVYEGIEYTSEGNRASSSIGTSYCLMPCADSWRFLAHGWRYGFQPGLYSIEIYRNLEIWLGLFSVVIAILFNTIRDVLMQRWTTELR